MGQVPLPFLQGVVVWLWVLAAVGGGMAITGSVLSLAITRHIAAETRRTAEARVSEAEAAAARARATAAQARQGVSDALARDVVAQQRDAEMRRRLTKLYQPLALGDRQVSTFVAQCSDAAGARFDATADGGDSQSFEFLQMLRPMLADAGWVEVDWSGDAAALGRPPHAEIGARAAPAVILLTHRGADPGLAEAVRTLQRALTAIGVLATAQVTDWAGGQDGHALRTDVVHLIVSKRVS
jgi:hypothetical protein